MKYLAFILFSICLNTNTLKGQAQEKFSQAGILSDNLILVTENKRPLNNISVSLLGDFTLIGANYERFVPIESGLHLSGKIGLGYLREIFCVWGCEYDHGFATIPYHLTANFGRKRSFLEVGIGATYVVNNFNLPYAIVGYKFLSMEAGKINFRVFGQLPLSYQDAPPERSFYTNHLLFIPFGVSVGFGF